MNADESRFWSKVDQSGGPDACWPWLPCKGKKEYGRYRGNDGKMIGPHRVACESKHGPLGDQLALHSCDNPPCCNPSHLFPGTNKDNSDDRDRKGRLVVVKSCGDRNGARTKPESRAVGERSGATKMTESQVLEIKAKAATGMSQSEISKSYPCTRQTVGRILNNKYWKHLNGATL